MSDAVAQASVRGDPVLAPCSVLFPEFAAGRGAGTSEQPEFFADLNLDQVLASITAGHEDYDLAPFFCEPPADLSAILYRQEVFRDLELPAVAESITSFAQAMRDMRGQLGVSAKLRYKYQKESWFLEAAGKYCSAVSCLARDLAPLDIGSRGLLAFVAYLSSYVASTSFTTLVAETQQVRDELAQVRYCVHIRGPRVLVRKYEAESDYSTDVLKTFDRFKQGAAKDYRVAFRGEAEMNHVEATILDLVAQLFGDAFSALDSYSTRHGDFLDLTIGTFDREVQFFCSYLDYIGRMRAGGLTFCYPEVCAQSKEICADDTFDLALANMLTSQRKPVVCNDFFLEGHERIFVVSGPNQGGKTTFARTVGQLHYLASLGCPVPGRRARLFRPERLFTHFGREEDLSNLSGKLEDDLVRIRDILRAAPPDSLVIVNEIFSSTTLNDALFLGTKVLQRIIELELVCVFVTFVEEFSSLSKSTVSMVSSIAPETPTERTYKVVRKPADGLAYAIAIAEKYGLTYDRLTERLAP